MKDVASWHSAKASFCKTTSNVECFVQKSEARTCGRTLISANSYFGCNLIWRHCLCTFLLIRCSYGTLVDTILHLSLGHKTSNSSLHLDLTFVSFSGVRFVRFFSAISLLKVPFQLVLGLPLFLIPGDVQVKLFLEMFDGAILKAWPSHLNLHFFISSLMFHVIQKHLWWKSSPSLNSIFTSLQHSDPCKSTVSTLPL